MNMAPTGAGPESPEPIPGLHPMRQPRFGKGMQPPVNADPVESRSLQSVQNLRLGQGMIRLQEDTEHGYPPRSAFQSRFTQHSFRFLLDHDRFAILY